MVTPEVSECRRIPRSLRPDSAAATPWAPSCAIVTTCRVRRHAGRQATSPSATAAQASTAGSGSGGAVALARCHAVASASAAAEVQATVASCRLALRRHAGLAGCRPVRPARMEP